ncbi:MAG: hypothetical protein WC058_03400 [Phycisphaeraceae bacterium]
MKTSEILCLANSPKENARCIAGLDLATHQFVRPVAVGSQAIPQEWANVDCETVEPLDIIHIPLVRGDAVVPYQAENRYCSDGWKRMGRWRADQVQRFCESDSLLLGTASSQAIPERLFKMTRLGRPEWKSLQLIHAPNVIFNQTNDKWTGHFRTSNGREYDLRVTDEGFTRTLKDSTQRACILLLSLTRPWRHYLAPKSKPKKCYKLIAGVMPL